MKEKEKILTLMQTCRDRENFYKMAAKDTLDHDLIPLFNQLEFQSRQFLYELETYSGIPFLQHDPDELNYKLGKILSELKEVFYRAGTAKMLKNAIKAEESFLKKYSCDKLPEFLHAICGSQASFVRTNLKKLKNYTRETQLS
ncbi:MAG: hypothetical protein ACK4ND_03790 [Cytophagaceae bacterium]